MLVQRGTLRVGDSVVAGPQWGKVRRCRTTPAPGIEEADSRRPGRGARLRRRLPRPASASRWSRTTAGPASSPASARTGSRPSSSPARQSRRLTLDEVFSKAREGELNELNILLKADVSGSLEALQDEIAKLPQDEIGVNVIRAAAGGINESDVMLAAASDAIVIGFNVRPLADARRAADREGVEIRTYSVIYKVTEELRAAMEGMLAPEEVEETLGQAEVLELFKASKVGTIAGCSVTDGKRHPRRRGPPRARRHRRLDRPGRLAAPLQGRRCARSRRARSAASCSRASRTSRSAT